VTAACSWWRTAARSNSRTPSGGGGGDGLITPLNHPQSRATTHVRCLSEGVGCGTSTQDVHVDTDALIASYLSEAQVCQVRTFAATLLEWNKNMNLTGAGTIEDVLQRHVADSLALIPAIEAALSGASGEDSDGEGGDTTRAPPGQTLVRILDVGSGAGFPGVALAIARPHWEVTLLDTLQKRTTFLDAAAAECGAVNVRTLWARAEDAGRIGSTHREAYDVVTARAVAELRVLAVGCRKPETPKPQT